MRNQQAGKSTLATIAVLFGFASLALVATYRPANACGGLFCNARPPDPFAPLPVAQNGENVVFSITKDPAGGAPTLQAHIQILYTGEAAKFSWVVPVDAAPELSTGTDRLFSQLASVTAPKFTTSPVIDGNCIPAPNSTGVGGAFGGTGTAGTTGGAGTGGSGVGGVMVNFQGAVGPFDAAVIKSDDATALKAWLTDNGYIISDQGSGLIDVYVRENKFFVALKLLNGVGVRSIQPIVLTFRGTEACVPLRLTAIAANPDMPVLVWVLSDKRVAPRGYYEMTIDEASINWLQNGTNYFGPTGLVSKAANEAGGNAFVTEYAGPSTVAQRSVYVNGTINLTTLMMAMTPPTYVQQLISMGLNTDPLMLPLLQKYIPMPDALKTMGSATCGSSSGTGGTGGSTGVTPSQFYGNISCYWNNYAFPAYDLAGLTQAISDSIVTPRINAQMMIDGHPYLTRLNTFISPEEMTKDPFFFESRDLGNISNVHTAVLRTMCGAAEYMACNAPQRIELADGRTFWVRAGSKATTCQGTTPTVLSNLPAAEVAFERAETGEGTRVLDNRAAIAAGIAASNAAFPNEQMRFPIPSGTGGSTGVAGTGGGNQGSGGAGGAGSGWGGMGGTASPPAGGGGVSGPVGTGGAYPADNVGSVSGCSCATGGDAGSGAVILALAGLFSVRRRRRCR
jgi:MYXO-CTERM domain-containing protein